MMITAAKIKQRYSYSVILLKELVRTDFKVRYQNSILGYLWSLLKPLFMFIVLYVIFVEFLGIGANIEYWPAALFLGLVMWEFFNETTKQGLKSIVSKGSLIRKINFPKYIVVLSSSISALINLSLNLVVVAGFVLFMSVPLQASYFLIPIYVVELYLFGLGLAFILSALYVKARDINFIWEILMRAGFYASAVMFPISRVYLINETAGTILLMNPVAQTIQDARHLMLPNIPSTADYIGELVLIPILISVITFIIGAYYFRKKSQKFAEEV